MEKDGFLFPLKLNFFIRFDSPTLIIGICRIKEEKIRWTCFPFWGGVINASVFLVVGWFSFPNSLHSVTRDDEQTAARWLKSLACKLHSMRSVHTRMIRLLFFLAAVYGDRRDIVIPRKRRNFSCLFFLSLLLLSYSFFSSCRRRENRQNRTGSKPRNKMGRARMTTKKRWMMRALIALAHSDRTFSPLSFLCLFLSLCVDIISLHNTAHTQKEK